tara:strand:+ start:669 stop:956 length:288 start_codon:yes stop_codon:yes gene_type:complete
MINYEGFSLEHLINVIIIISVLEIIVLCIFLKNLNAIIKNQIFFLNICAGIFLLVAFAIAINEKPFIYSIFFLFFSGLCHLRCLIKFLKDLKNND